MGTMRALSSELATVATDLQAEPDIRHAAKRILRHATTLLGGDDAAVMFGHGTRKQILSASSVEAKRADQAQLELHEGPSVTAMSCREPVVVDDVTTDNRWRQWSGAISDMGLESALSLPLGTGRSTLGALSMYSSRRAAFDGKVTAIARLYATHASVAVSTARNESGLRQAIDARHAIGQAQGILMERYGIDAEQAFTLLRRGAHDHDVTLSEHARQVVAGRRGVAE